MPITTRTRAAAAALLGLICPLAAAQSWGGSLGLSSDYVFRGVSRSHGDPSLQADLHYAAPAGWFAGLAAASVERGVEQRTGAELSAYGGYAQPLGSAWMASASWLHYEYPSSASYRYDELSATLAWGERVFLSVAASPDTRVESAYGRSRRAAAFAYELGLRQPLIERLAFEGGVGYYDLRRQLRQGYAYWSAGLGYGWRRWRLQLAYGGIQPGRRHLFYDGVADNRWSASALWRF